MNMTIEDKNVRMAVLEQLLEKLKLLDLNALLTQTIALEISKEVPHPPDWDRESVKNNMLVGAAWGFSCAMRFFLDTVSES